VLADGAVVPWVGLPALELHENTTGAAPAQRTSVKVAWTAGELRVLFRCEDMRPWATMTKRDAPLYEEEVVEVFIDPVGDLATYFEIEVNPLNAVLDLVLRRNRSGYAKDFSWRCDDLRTAARVMDSSWTVELAIPFRSLVAAPPKAGSQWRINFYRIDRPLEKPRELSAWSPTRLGTFHVPERFGVLEFQD
jgi:hypothetical protein